MKNKIKIMLVIIACILLTACKKDNYVELSYKELNKKIENKDSFVLTISAKSCINCEIFKDTIKEINKKYNITTYYIDLDKLTSDEENTLKQLYLYTGTPTTINIISGKEENKLNRIIGSSDYLTIKERLINWSYIKE